MKIAIIGHKRVPSREGGIEKTVEKQAALLCERGHELVLYNRSGDSLFAEETASGSRNVSSEGSGGDTSPGGRRGGASSESRGSAARSEDSGFREELPAGIRIETVYTPKNSLGVPVYSFLATLKALREKCDIIYYHGSGSCRMIPLAKFFGARCVGFIHGIDSRQVKWNRFGRAYLRRGEKAAAKRADACLVLSENNREYIRRTYGTEAVRTFNGAEAPRRIPADWDAVSARFGLREGEYLLNTGRIIPGKGLEYLIRAFRSCVTDKRLVIAGGVDPVCRKHYRELRQLAAGDERILFTGFLGERELNALYLHAYAFVFPSDQEGMSHSLLEAMAAGCCCLASDIPENSEVVRDHGLLFRRGDTGDLREKLQQILKDPECPAGFRAKAAEYILREYRWDACVDQIESIFRRVLSGCFFGR